MIWVILTGVACFFGGAVWGLYLMPYRINESYRQEARRLRYIINGYCTCDCVAAFEEGEEVFDRIENDAIVD